MDLGLNDLLVDEPVGHVHAPGGGHAIKPPPRNGPAAQQCSYEELDVGVGSDCSADDFDMIFDNMPSQRPPLGSRSSSSSSCMAGRLAGRVPSMMPATLGRAASGGRVGLGGIGGSSQRNERAKEQRAVEKHSLLTDLDLLVS